MKGENATQHSAKHPGGGDRIGEGKFGVHPAAGIPKKDRMPRSEVAVKYPTLEEVEQANREQICRWWRFLKSPGQEAIGQPNFEQVLEQQKRIMDRIAERFQELGGFTPEISKRIGW